MSTEAQPAQLQVHQHVFLANLEEENAKFAHFLREHDVGARVHDSCSSLKELIATPLLELIQKHHRHEDRLKTMSTLSGFFFFVPAILGYITNVNSTAEEDEKLTEQVIKALQGSFISALVQDCLYFTEGRGQPIHYFQNTHFGHIDSLIYNPQS